MDEFAKVSKEKSHIRNEMIRARNRLYIYCDYTGHTQRLCLNNTLLLKTTDCRFIPEER